MPFEEGKFKADIVDLADTTSCVALSFPPGLFVQIYKFYREGEVCCSIKSRGLASVADSFFYPFRTILRNVLNVPKVRAVGCSSIPHRRDRLVSLSGPSPAGHSCKTQLYNH